MALTSTSGEHLIQGTLPTGPPLNWLYQMKGFISKAGKRWEANQSPFIYLLNFTHRKCEETKFILSI